MEPAWIPSETAAGLRELAMELRDRLAASTGAAAIILMAIEPDGSLRIVGTANAPAQVVSQWQRVPPQVGTAAMAAATSGRAIWLPDLVRAREKYLLIGDRDCWPSRAWLPVRSGVRVVGLIGVLWETPCAFDTATRRSVARAAATRAGRLRQLLATAPVDEGWGGWLASVQTVLDMLPASAAVLSPVHDDAGEVVDYVIEAASPEAIDVAGRRGGELVGLRILECYPTIGDSPLWTAYQQVLTGGQTREVGPFTYVEVTGGIPAEAVYSFRVSRLGAGVLVSWARHDERQRQAERVARTERLGNLGWFERDLLTGRAQWSDQIYQIFGADPAGGPLALDAIRGLVLPEDAAEWAGAMAALIEGGERMDVGYRVRVDGAVKYLRSYGEAIRDAAGRTLGVYGMVQDVTVREEARERLGDVQRQLAEHRRSLEAEHRLAVELQQMILPVLDVPVDLPGVQVAVRYLPAEQLARIGGDWYHAAALPCGRTMLAIGDVAGHGLPAAATMARLRHALAALAAATTEPAELLRLLNRVLFDADDGATATAVVARYDPVRQSLTWAQAGHPAPLLARAGVPAPLPRPRGLLLGAVRDATYATATVPMGADDLLLLYTDGLVERPGRTVHEGLGQVVKAIADAIPAVSDQPLTQLLAGLHQANPEDDTCVLAARSLASPSEPHQTGMSSSGARNSRRLPKQSAL
ncbi:MAG: Phosphoserine phosphatase rsbP [Dactylosporangium sp.]|nr:Phosphoserine phosphatase rsbP [Dactylosporangium sp.]